MTGRQRLHYLSTLNFPAEWLAALRAAVPDVRISQIPADKVTDVPADVWATVDALHTSAVLPDPGQAPALRWVQLDTSGVDHVRGAGLWDASPEFTTIGGVSPVPLAEYVMLAILGFAHRLPAMLDVGRTRSWPTPGARWERFLPRSLPTATVAVLGYGRIGREVGRLATAHGLTVIGVNRTGSRRESEQRPEMLDFGRTLDDSHVEVLGPDRLHEALGRSDYVVVITPLTAATRNLVDAEAIAATKPGAVLINAARGGIVDEAALLAAVRSGAIGGAVLDVFDDEPLPPDSPWWDEPNVLVTPHVAGLAPLYSEQVLELVIQNLRRFRDGEPLLNRVDKVLGY